MWTDDQLKAIKAPVGDILVTAAAGSGKTAVMVERIIERVIAPDGTDIDKMLVVTFTKAAASEIKERIAAKISEKLSEGGNERLKNQLVLINRASICTIHSFCLEIIKENFHLLSLDPNFKVADTSEIAILKAKAMGDVLDGYYENEDDKQFYRLINSFTKKNDSAVEKMISDVYDFSCSMADPLLWLEECENVYAGDCNKQLSYVLDEVRKDASYCSELYSKAIKLCQFDSSFDKCREILTEEMLLADGIVKLCTDGWDSVYGFIKDYKFAVLRSNKNMDASVYDEVKNIRNRSRDILKTIIAHKVNLPVEIIKEDLVYMKPCISKLCELVRAYGDRYTQYKREKNLVDFNDFEHLALSVLTNPQFSEVADSLRQRYDEIYVDEYQDCNGVQEAVFKAISREGRGEPNMFMVGDMKQCIYRFRNADPQLFKSKSEMYTPYNGEINDYSKITLSKNFRSRTQILNGANKIFSAIMSDSVGGIDYTPEEYLYTGAQYNDTNSDMNCIDVNIIDASGKFGSDEFEDIEEKPAKIEAEARFVARKIYEMVKSGCYTVYDKSADIYRPLKYRDIVILLRGVRGNSDYFADALSQYAIPSFSDVGGGYFDCEEVVLILNLLKIITNPLDDIRLVSVMRSPIFRFTDSELVQIRSTLRDGYFYSAVEKYLNTGDALSSKLRAFLKTIDKYKEQSYIMDTDEFLRYIVDDTGFMDYIGTLPGASVKKANIRMLINRASQFTAGGGTPSRFALYVDQMRTSGGDGEGAKIIGENDDVVRIMTIHKSKGLEFPVVFLSMCGKKFNTRDTSDALIMHNELGLGIDYVDEKKRFSYKPVVKSAIASKIFSENLSEEMRLLYVALTRAREKLIITGVADDFAKLEDFVCSLCDGSGKISDRAVSSCKSFMQWIMCALFDGGVTGYLQIEGSGFKRDVVSVYDMSSKDISVSNEERSIPEEAPKSRYNGEIIRRLDYSYPYAHLAALPRNVTVTEIKRLSEINDGSAYRLYRMPVLKRPAFLSGEVDFDSAYIGTVMHLCMQKIELTSLKKGDTIEGEIQRLVREGIITEQEATCVDTGAIEQFFASEPGKSMLCSDSVYREIPFGIFVDAGEIFPDVSTDEKIVVQGMIDAYFTDKDGNLILVDYKTDRRKGLSADEFEQLIVHRYNKQIYYYEKALRLLTGRSVHKKYIYLFDTGAAVEIL